MIEGSSNQCCPAGSFKRGSRGKISLSGWKRGQEARNGHSEGPSEGTGGAAAAPAPQTPRNWGPCLLGPGWGQVDLSHCKDPPQPWMCQQSTKLLPGEDNRDPDSTSLGADKAHFFLSCWDWDNWGINRNAFLTYFLSD